MSAKIVLESSTRSQLRACVRRNFLPFDSNSRLPTRFMAQLLARVDKCTMSASFAYTVRLLSHSTETSVDVVLLINSVHHATHSSFVWMSNRPPSCARACVRACFVQLLKLAVLGRHHGRGRSMPAVVAALLFGGKIGRKDTR